MCVSGFSLVKVRHSKSELIFYFIHIFVHFFFFFFSTLCSVFSVKCLGSEQKPRYSD